MRSNNTSAMRNNMGNFVIHCGLAISASPFTYGIACGVKPNFLQWIFSKEHAADIGYVLSRNLWGGGYMTEAANAVVEWAINLSSVYRVWAVCDCENKADAPDIIGALSARVLEKVGMQREGILRRYIVHPNVSAE